jgi:hypothetical protein
MTKFTTRLFSVFFVALIVVGFSTPTIAQSYSFRYLGSFSADGTPQYFASRDTVSASFVNRINASLPERYPVPTYNPQYIRPNSVTDIILQDSAEVWVTFIAEGAGYKNVLGFYTYSLDNPPTQKPTNITIAFPNVSASGSGGSLLAGHRVKLGNFSPRTGIGWVLIADGFRNGQVTTGNWVLYGNPKFNPEADTSKRHHNVQLLDTLGKIVIGFEDIRRDNAGCDNDFNDAIFYVSATPTRAIATDGLLTTVGFNGSSSSGNDGGLESNGSLAGAIATRNFHRIQESQANAADKLANLERFVTRTNGVLLRGANNLQDFLPQQPIENVAAFITTPNDLKGITNAQQVFSVDYFEDKERQAAILATQTDGKVYEHTKAICDRLKGATLTDTRVFDLEGTPFILSTLTQEDGSIEYAVSFSAYQRGDSVGIESHWTVEEFSTKPTFYNFQIWSKTPHWTLKIAQEVKALLANRFRLVQNTAQTPRTPQVFVKNGIYDNGKLTLHIKNDIAATALILRGSLTRSETSSRQSFTQNIALSGAKEQTIAVQIGQIFDAGFQLDNNRDNQADALYLADGAWGLEYATGEASVQNFETEAQNTPLSNSDKTQYLPRAATLKGKVKTYVSLFRTLRPTSKAVKIEGATHLSFDAVGKTPTGVLEVVLVKKSITDWSKQYKTVVLVPANTTTLHIPLSQFKNGTTQNLTTNDITTVVFTAKGNQKTAEDVQLSVNNLRFDAPNSALRLEENNNPRVSPNPTTRQTLLRFESVDAQNTQISLVGMNGQVLKNWAMTTTEGTNQLPIALDDVATGVYAVQIADARGVQVVRVVKQ